MSKHDDLVKKLKEIFQIDKPELDFGIYRIINARVIEINDYLENRLKSKVSASLLASGAATVDGVHKELQEKEAQYRADGIDPETVPKVRELRKKLADYTVGTSEHENAVFTHLLTFFSRYYDNGDFISQRRYKGDTYAIPYAGEEVLLHWANKDQYYTKSGENFSNYAFKLDDGRSVRFRLVTADTAKDNRKDNDKERRFILIEEHTRMLTDDEGGDYEETLLPITEENNELVLRFEYKAMPKGTKQETLILDATNKVLADSIVKARWLDLNKREPTEKNPQRTLLEKCLTSYTAKNSADYFIHKDLGSFLRRELDFYIKNEVMHLDDVQNAEKFADIEKNLRLIQTLRAIALDLITFLAQLEDFQLKLWLKKKFVVATHYCITLDRVPESLYPTIAANPLQWEQWKSLGMLEAFPPSPHRGEERGEGQNNPQIKTRTKTERSEILNTFAQEMRQAPTETEARMWYFLRNRRLGGWKFRRQHPVGKYIADFICVDARLVIELDGGQHADLFAQQGDEERTAFLAERGLRVLRFWNNDFLQQTEAVLEQILLALDESVSPHPNPLPGGERELEHKAHSILGQDNKTASLSGSDNKPLSHLEPGNKALPHLKPSNEVLAPSGRGLGEGQEQITYLKENPYLMVDTALFDAAFKHALLATVDNLDDSLDGLLIHGDNFQALNLLQDRYREQINCIYIDPPYNTDASAICYKNGYKSSSWVSLIQGRLQKTRSMMTDDGVLVAAIDDAQQRELSFLLSETFSENLLGTICVRSNPSGRPTQTGYAVSHEYLLVAGQSEKSVIGRLPPTPDQKARFNQSDEDGFFEWRNMRREGSNSDRNARKALYYPMYINGYEIRVPKMSWDESAESWVIEEQPTEMDKVVYPDNEDGIQKTWRWEGKTIMKSISSLAVRKDRSGKDYVYYKRRPNEDGVVSVSSWFDAKYSATEHGTALLKNLFGSSQFSFPKSIHAVVDSIYISGASNPKALTLDYFAGSGTTAHAVINLNREDEGKRKYILVEQGDYFDTVLKPRIQKVVYSANWKDGKPCASSLPSPQKGEGKEAPSPLRGEGWGEGKFNGISHAFKVLKLESYEDTLNNLQLRRTKPQQELLESLTQSAQEDYLLRYLLDIESRGSLLSVEQFNKPFDCKLKVTVDSAGAYQERTIDLVETFNYLIGLRVKHIDMQLGKGFVAVTGWLPTGEKTLVLWRDVEQVDYETLNRLCDKLAINPADSEFAIVYINGDHNIPAVFTSTEAEGGITKTLKIRQIEPEFLSRMFAVDGV